MNKDTAGNTLTIGDNSSGGWVDSWGIWHPYQIGGLIQWTTPQTYCSGDIHVWACEHAENCKCGQARRTPPECPACQLAKSK